MDRNLTFKTKELDARDKETLQKIMEQAKTLGSYIQQCGVNVEKTISLRKLQETVMWAEASLERPDELDIEIHDEKFMENLLNAQDKAE